MNQQNFLANDDSLTRPTWDLFRVGQVMLTEHIIQTYLLNIINNRD